MPKYPKVARPKAKHLSLFKKKNTWSSQKTRSLGSLVEDRVGTSRGVKLWDHILKDLRQARRFDRLARLEADRPLKKTQIKRIESHVC